MKNLTNFTAYFEKITTNVFVSEGTNLRFGLANPNIFGIFAREREDLNL
jgi:hypothetical protein